MTGSMTIKSLIQDRPHALSSTYVTDLTNSILSSSGMDRARNDSYLRKNEEFSYL